MENIILTSTHFIAQLIELLAVIIICYASFFAFYTYFKEGFSKSNQLIHYTEIRLSLGKSLAVGLELLLGADILNTAVAPSWDEIGKLAAIATIRTALNYFLERELKQSHSKKSETRSDETT